MPFFIQTSLDLPPFHAFVVKPSISDFIRQRSKVLASISVPLGIVGAGIKEIIDVTGVNHSVKSVPSCFKKDTLLRGTNNTLYSIDSIPLGTQLTHGGKVTSILKLDASKETMFKLGSVTVSGSHKVKYENK